MSDFYMREPLDPDRMPWAEHARSARHKAQVTGETCVVFQNGSSWYDVMRLDDFAQECTGKSLLYVVSPWGWYYRRMR